MNLFVNRPLVGALVLSVSLHASHGYAALLAENGYALDTETGLEWINQQVTDGYSYQAIQAGAGGFIAAGWHYATVSQWNALMTRYVGPANLTQSASTFYEAASQSYFNSANNVVLILGMNAAFNDSRAVDNITSNPDYHQVTSEGFLQVGPRGLASLGDLTAVYSAPTNYPFPLSPYGRWGAEVDWLPTDTSGPWGANFLVRSVPEPDSLWLLGIGLMGLAPLRRRSASGRPQWKQGVAEH